jgi:hypothetical protein
MLIYIASSLPSTSDGVIHTLPTLTLPPPSRIIRTCERETQVALVGVDSTRITLRRVPTCEIDTNQLNPLTLTFAAGSEGVRGGVGTEGRYLRRDLRVGRGVDSKCRCRWST